MPSFFTLSFVTEMVSSIIRMAVPLTLVAIGELYSERAGLINIGLDGIMSIGTIAGFIGCYISGSPLVGLLCGAAVGWLLNMIYAFCTISLRSGQIINGMALNILGPALSTFIFRIYFGVTSELKAVATMGFISIPLLNKIPVAGKSIFSAQPIFYFTLLLVAATAVFFYRTKMGLNFMAVGEYPRAAESMGINVIRIKYLACSICGLLAGAGGAYMTTCYMSSFGEDMVSGRGFIALAAVIFGGWSPGGILLATLLFGFVDALQMRLQVLINVPYQFLAMLPYVITFIAIVMRRSRHGSPKSVGQPYFREGSLN